MISNGETNSYEGESTSNIKSILKTVYEMQVKAKLPIFKGILHDTIPIVFNSSDATEPYFAYGITSTCQTSFRTCFFRIEDLVHSIVHLSLLYPIDIEGNYTDTIRMPYGLEKTQINVIVSVQDFCSIQCINPNLINRQSIIIGDKW
ncbi:CotY/CotZ family spore coat protein [Psychrobacillus sp. FSL K6-2684]|uniref:Uncharacterized protein n=1 Tax=Psychrobacillus faecigallinarum TaxID=2762235 RepID=A0ABR8R7Q4_9BACI|nr:MULTISPECIES: CotY/CotZ family spore coat protein [Psychrobacillus]MBD7943819.1 hypothetical protein [Psychrobacillus faecigallinarum]QEY19331.1 hypothetical protein D0S48_00680 [Psychrobacillus sp. AK 1817]